MARSSPGASNNDFDGFEAFKSASPTSSVASGDTPIANNPLHASSSGASNGNGSSGAGGFLGIFDQSPQSSPQGTAGQQKPAQQQQASGPATKDIMAMFDTPAPGSNRGMPMQMQMAGMQAPMGLGHAMQLQQMQMMQNPYAAQQAAYGGYAQQPQLGVGGYPSVAAPLSRHPTYPQYPAASPMQPMQLYPQISQSAVLSRPAPAAGLQGIMASYGAAAQPAVSSANLLAGYGAPAASAYGSGFRPAAAAVPAASSANAFDFGGFSSAAAPRAQPAAVSAQPNFLF